MRYQYCVFSTTRICLRNSPTHRVYPNVSTKREGTHKDARTGILLISTHNGSQHIYPHFSTMPKYFRMSRFSSFQRQLVSTKKAKRLCCDSLAHLLLPTLFCKFQNLYEFNRVTEGPNKGSYYHERFMKGRPDLCSTIRRNKIKSENPSNQKRDPFVPMGSAAAATQLPQQLRALPMEQRDQRAASISSASLLQTLARRGIL